MKRYLVLPLLICTVVFFTPNLCNAQLTIKLNGLQPNKGKILFAFYTSEGDFLDEDKAYKKFINSVSELTAFTFSNLPKGKYSVAVFQDLNGNNKLDKNFFGIPTEPYGFSNDASGTFGPPDFSDAIINYNQSEMTHTITID